MALVSSLVPILFVGDLRAERDFYVALGFRVTYEGDEFPGFIAFADGDVEFGLERRDGFRREAPDAVLRWQFRVSDVALARRTLEGAGCVTASRSWRHDPIGVTRCCTSRRPTGTP